MIRKSGDTPKGFDPGKLPKKTVSVANMGRYPLRAIRACCLDCTGGNWKYIKHCSCDGVHSVYCSLWPFRFGTGPDAARRAHGEQFLDPWQMPDANVNLDDLQQEFVKLRITAVRGNLPDPLPLQDLLTCQRNRSEALFIVRARPGRELDHIIYGMDGTFDELPLSLEELYGLVLSHRSAEPAP